MGPGSNSRKVKPTNLVPLFDDLAQQLKSASETGFLVRGRRVRMRLHSLLGDHPAMQEALGLAGSAAATHACRMCMQQTVVTTVGSRKPKSCPYASFLDDCEGDNFFRTAVAVCQQADEPDSLKTYGVNMVSRVPR